MIVKDMIFYVGGGKGGVGKSMVSILLIQFLIDKYGQDKKIHLIEADLSNPDVSRIYENEEMISIHRMTLDDDNDTRGDWFRMFELIEKNPNSFFVINSGARGSVGIRGQGGNLAAALSSGSLSHGFAVFWPINRQRDSLLLLEEFLGLVTSGLVFPIRNNYFGNPDDFTLYDKNSKSNPLKSRLVKTLDLPALANILVDSIYIDGKTIPKTMNELGVFAKIGLSSWVSKVYGMFEQTGIFTEGREIVQELYDKGVDAEQKRNNKNKQRVFELLAAGQSPKQIIETTGLSRGTVYNFSKEFKDAKNVPASEQAKASDNDKSDDDKPRDEETETNEDEEAPAQKQAKALDEATSDKRDTDKPRAIDDDEAAPTSEQTKADKRDDDKSRDKEAETDENEEAPAQKQVKALDDEATSDKRDTDKPRAIDDDEAAPASEQAKAPDKRNDDDKSRDKEAY